MTMKKVLFATTALIATASMAAAEVRISGYGRFGLDYNDANDNDVLSPTFNGLSKTNITSRLRLQFDMSTETDSGVALGARFRAQADSRGNVPGGAVFNGARFFATYQGFSVGVGNIIGAVENMPGLYLETASAGTGIDGAGYVSVVTNVNGEYFNWDSYSSGGAGANGVELIYTAGGFVGHLSYSADNGVVGIPPAPNVAGTDRFAAMATYTFGDWTMAIAAQDSDTLWEDKVVVSAAGNIGDFGVRVAYADNDGISKWGLYGNMDIGAASNVLLWVTDEEAVDAVDVALGRNDNRDTLLVDGQEGTSYGIHYSYDLGGGASIEAGYRHQSNSNDRFQAGVFFRF
jgi:outer membrane protein OmpU